MATGYAGIVMSPNGPMPVDAYLKVIRKQKDKERQKQRRGKNNYGFNDENPEDDGGYHKSHKSGGYKSGGYGGYGSSGNSGGYGSSGNSGGYGGYGSSGNSGYGGGSSYSKPRTDKYGHYGSDDKAGGYNNSKSYNDSKPNNIRSKKLRNSNFDSDDETTSSNDQVYTRARRRDPFADEAPPTRQKVQYHDYSDDDAYDNGGYNQGGNFKADPFAAAGGPRSNKRRGDPFGNDDNYDQRYQQPQRSNQQFGATGSSGAFPKAKKDLLGGQQGNDENDFDLFGGSQQQPRGDLFSNQQQPRGDPFGNQQQPFGNQQQPRGDPFGNQQQPRGDPFGNQSRGDPFGGQQQPRGNPFAGQRQQNGFPQAKSNSAKRNDPFSRKRGFNDDDDDEDDAPAFNLQQRTPFQQQQPQQQFQQQQFQQQQYQPEEQFFNQAPPQNADDLLFGDGGFSAQPAQTNNNDDFINLSVTPQQSKQQKADPLAEYGDLVDLNFNKKTREHGKALGSLGSMGSLGSKGGYPRPPPVQNQQPFGNF